MKSNIVKRFALLILLFTIGCTNEKSGWLAKWDIQEKYLAKWNEREEAANSLRIGQKMPDSLKTNLVEANLKFEKWRIHSHYFTIENNKIVAIWVWQ